MDTDDLNAILANAGVNNPEDADDAWKQVKKETDSAFATAVSDVLGEEGMQQFARFENNEALWQYVSGFAAEAAQCGIPLTLQQADKLVDVMASAPDRRQGTLTNTEAGWSYIDEQAQTFLSKEQAEMLRTAGFGNSIGMTRFEILLFKAQQDARIDMREKQNASGGNGD